MVTAGTEDSAKRAPRVAVLSRKGHQRFEMFSLLSLSGDRAILAGPLLLEIGERVRLSIAVAGDEVHIESVVESIDWARKAIAVRFPDAPSTDRARLESAAGSWG